MQSLDSSSSGMCTVGRPSEESRSVECKFKQMVAAQQKILDSFLEIDCQLDGEEDREERGSTEKKRRKKWSSRSSDFLSVSTKTAQEDLDEIFGDSPSGSQTHSDVDFKVNDVVACTLGKRRFKGTVFRTSSKGVVIKTSDRKKIKLEWDTINGDEIQLVKLDEIEEIIDQFPDKDREALSVFYIDSSRRKFRESTPIKRHRICLLKSNLKYIPEKKRAEYIDEIMGIKVLQTRALILDLVCSNYTIEKEYIYKPESWIELIVADIFETFALPEELQLFETYNRQLCEEILMIFCSCEKFQSSGNQLILNIVMYKDKVGPYTGYDFGKLVAKLVPRFHKGAFWGMDRINEIYVEHLSRVSRGTK